MRRGFGSGLEIGVGVGGSDVTGQNIVADKRRMVGRSLVTSI